VLRPWRAACCDASMHVNRVLEPKRYRWRALQGGAESSPSLGKRDLVPLSQGSPRREFGTKCVYQIARLGHIERARDESGARG